MKINLLIIILFVFIESNGQIHPTKEHIYLDKLEHLEITKIIYYETPYRTEYWKPLESKFKPDWYLAHCSILYPPAFKNYVKEAKHYISKDRNINENMLAENYNEFKSQSETKSGSFFNKPYSYFFADIYFSHKKSKKKYIISLHYSFKEKLKIFDFSKVNSEKLLMVENKVKSGEIQKDDLNFKLKNQSVSSLYYVLENGVYKSADNVDILLNVILNGKKNIFIRGAKIEDFLKILNRSSKYEKSIIVNNNRKFETIKN